MSHIQSIFGLKSRQIIEPQYFDIKLMYDQTAFWRAKTLDTLLEMRGIKGRLGRSRCLGERQCLYAELSAAGIAMKSCRGVYREVRREAYRLEDLYLDALDRKLAKLGSRRTA